MNLALLLDESAAGETLDFQAIHQARVLDAILLTELGTDKEGGRAAEAVDCTAPVRKSCTIDVLNVSAENEWDGMKILLGI